jgi:hypothetical protein
MTYRVEIAELKFPSRCPLAHEIASLTSM